MSEVTVSQLASDVGIPVDRLLKQLSDAGIAKQSAEDVITEQEKVDLLNHLRRSHGKSAAAGAAPLAATDCDRPSQPADRISQSAAAHGRWGRGFRQLCPLS